jgi:hypothetical protein
MEFLPREIFFIFLGSISHVDSCRLALKQKRRKNAESSISTIFLPLDVYDIKFQGEAESSTVSDEENIKKTWFRISRDKRTRAKHICLFVELFIQRKARKSIESEPV